MVYVVDSSITHVPDRSNGPSLSFHISTAYRFAPDTFSHCIHGRRRETWSLAAEAARLPLCHPSLATSACRRPDDGTAAVPAARDLAAIKKCVLHSPQYIIALLPFAQIYSPCSYTRLRMRARGIEITGAQFFGAGMRPMHMQGVRTASARSRKKNCMGHLFIST
jgi:hypothetical protein